MVFQGGKDDNANLARIPINGTIIFESNYIR